jgi:hypothetical protein
MKLETLKANAQAKNCEITMKKENDTNYIVLRHPNKQTYYWFAIAKDGSVEFEQSYSLTKELGFFGKGEAKRVKTIFGFFTKEVKAKETKKSAGKKYPSPKVATNQNKRAVAKDKVTKIQVAAPVKTNGNNKKANGK